jgi:hypothetical protein
MDTPSGPASADPRPPHGVDFTDEGDCPLAGISSDLRKIAAFLQGLAPFSGLVRYDDWRDHDGLCFESDRIDFHGLFQLIQTPRAILSTTPGDEYVCTGIAPDDRRWYLRFRAEWDDPDENLLGTYCLTLDAELAERFETEVVPFLESPVRRAWPSSRTSP